MEEFRFLRARNPTIFANHLRCLSGVELLLAVLNEQKRFEEAERLIRSSAGEVESVRSLKKEDLERLRQVFARAILERLPALEARQQRYFAAGASVEERLRWPMKEAVDWLRVAEVLARCSFMARADDRTPLQIRESIARRQDDRVIQLLQQAVTRKPALRSILAKRPALAGLRERADFQELLEK